MKLQFEGLKNFFDDSIEKTKKIKKRGRPKGSTKKKTELLRVKKKRGRKPKFLKLREIGEERKELEGPHENSFQKHLDEKRRKETERMLEPEGFFNEKELEGLIDKSISKPPRPSMYRNSALLLNNNDLDLDYLKSLDKKLQKESKF